MKKAVVIGHSYLSRLSIIRALGELGYDITVIINSSKILQADCYSKYVRRVLVCSFSEEERFVRLLLEECINKVGKTILMPTSDRSVSIIDKHQDELKDYFVFSHINHSSGQIIHWMDKSVQKELARKQGLNVAGSWQIEIKNQGFTIPDVIVYPCFVKPQITLCGGKTAFKRCNDETELRQFIYEMGQRWGNIGLLVERYLVVDKEYAVVGFSDGENVCIPGIIHLEQVSQSHFGVARSGRVLPIGSFQPLTERFKSYVKAVGYVGLFDIDFLECQGRYYFCELNFRFGGSGDALTRMGVNLPVMFAERLPTGQTGAFPSEITTEATFMNERVCLDDWYSGYLTMREYKELEKSVDFGLLYDPNDPRPYSLFKRYYVKAIGLKRAARKFKAWIC